MASAFPIDAVTSASLVDAMGRTCEHRAHILDLVSPAPDRVLFGPAITIAYMPYRADIYRAEQHNFARLFYEAIGENGAGKVCVLASNGHARASVGGGTKLSRLHNHGLAGVLTDGRLRDFDAIAGYGFAAYCAGETTRAGGDEIVPFAANQPVCVGGVAILPGDFIYADKAGGVVIPAVHAEAVFEEAARIERADIGDLAVIRDEDPGEMMKRGRQEN